MKPGNTILLDDGLVRLTVLETTHTDIRCRVANNGVMKDHKGVNVPGVRLNMPYMSQRDREDLLFGVEQDRVHDPAPDDAWDERTADIIRCAQGKGMVDIRAAGLGGDDDRRERVDPVQAVHLL